MLLVLVRLGVLVGLVEGLDGLFEDGLHPRPPLLPQALGDAHHRVGGAVAVCEDACVEEVDAGGAGGVRQVYDAHPVREGVGDVFEDSVNEIGVGVYDDDGVSVPALGLLPHLVDCYVVHEGGLAHAGACDVEVMTSEQVFGEVDGHGLARGGVSHQSPSLIPLAEGMSPLEPDRSTRGVSSPAPGGCHRAATSRTPRTLRLPNSPGPAGWSSDGSGATGFTLSTLNRAPAGLSKWR